MLTWKSSEWGYDHLMERISQFNSGEKTQRWSCGTSKNIPIGARAFLMKQGKGLGGIFGAGYISQQPFESEHYNHEKMEQGKTALYIMVRFDHLFDPSSGIKVTTSELKELDEGLVRLQGSGKSIRSDVAAQIEALWLERVGGVGIPYPDELSEADVFIEGACKHVTVNSYERNPAARQKCLAHWGESCAVCGFHFQYFYGEVGKGYIHVHHLTPVSEIGQSYEVDPINDLRPVCPNCHSMLHRRNPPMSIAELKAQVSLYGRR